MANARGPSVSVRDAGTIKLPAYLTPATTTFLQADAQSSLFSGVTSNFGPRTGPKDPKNGPPILYLALHGLKMGPF